MSTSGKHHGGHIHTYTHEFFDSKYFLIEVYRSKEFLNEEQEGNYWSNLDSFGFTGIVVQFLQCTDSQLIRKKNVLKSDWGPGIFSPAFWKF